MSPLSWNDELANDLEPMDDKHREFVDCYNAAVAAPPESLGAALDALIEHTEGHFEMENRWMEVVGFPGCHRAEHDRVLAVLRDVRLRVGRGDLFLGKRLLEELPTWFKGHVDGMDAALAFHLASVGFDFATGTVPARAEGCGDGSACAGGTATDASTVSAA